MYFISSNPHKTKTLAASYLSSSSSLFFFFWFKLLSISGFCLTHSSPLKTSHLFGAISLTSDLTRSGTPRPVVVKRCSLTRNGGLWR
uniref:Uncharacterized protein n=1 Tax=Cannabis sativa TaxID=3483 RepID=A0A803R7W4_CANSA